MFLRIVLQDAFSEVAKNYPSLKLLVFVDDITALLMVKNKEVAEMAKKVMKKLKEEVEKKGPQMSVTENGEEGKSKMIASCGFLEKELQQCSKEEEVTMADSVETLGVDLRTRVKRLRVKEKARRKKCKVRFSLIKKNKVFPKKNYMKVGVKKLLRAGMVPGRTWRVHTDGSYRKIRLEEAGGSSSGQKEYNVVVLVHGNLWA